jgi:hypothetical protein
MISSFSRSKYSLLSCGFLLLALSCLSSTSIIVLAKSPSLLPPTKRRRPGRLPPPTTTPRIQPNDTKNVFQNNSSSNNNHKTSEAAWVSGGKNFLASALAAACSKLMLAPFDTIKTLQQHSIMATSVGTTATAAAAATTTPLSLVQTAQSILSRPKGVLELYVSSILSIDLRVSIFGFGFRIFGGCHANNHHLMVRMILSFVVGFV